MKPKTILPKSVLLLVFLMAQDCLAQSPVTPSFSCEHLFYLAIAESNNQDTRKLKSIIISTDSEVICKKVMDEKKRNIEHLSRINVPLKTTYSYTDSTRITKELVLETGEVTERMVKIDGSFYTVCSPDGAQVLSKSYVSHFEGIIVQASYDRSDNLKEKTVEIRNTKGDVDLRRRYSSSGSFHETRYEIEDSIQYMIKSEYDENGLRVSYEKKKHKIITEQKEVLLNSRGDVYRNHYFDENKNEVRVEIFLRNEPSQNDYKSYDELNRLVSYKVIHLIRNTETLYELQYDTNGYVTRIDWFGEDFDLPKSEKKSISYTFEYEFY